MWGKEAPFTFSDYEFRITPTCVGKRKRNKNLALLAEDHPHVCGEKAVEVAHFYGGLGSPPRVWGKVAEPDRLVVVDGITPTCVGKRLKKAQILRTFS